MLLLWKPFHLIKQTSTEDGYGFIVLLWVSSGKELLVDRSLRIFIAWWLTLVIQWWRIAGYRLDNNADNNEYSCKWLVLIKQTAQNDKARQQMVVSPSHVAKNITWWPNLLIKWCVVETRNHETTTMADGHWRSIMVKSIQINPCGRRIVADHRTHDL